MLQFFGGRFLSLDAAMFAPETRLLQKQSVAILLVLPQRFDQAGSASVLTRVGSYA